MKLNPNLNDWWTDKGRTDLTLHDDSFSGAGISVKVILDVFKDNKDIYFFSELIGAHNDDLFILGIDRGSEILKDIKKEKYTNEETPIRNWYGEELAINEFKLNEDLKKQLEISKNEDFFSLDNSNIKYRFYFHDNFISRIYQIEEKLLMRILTNIKQLHNFYIDDVITNEKFETIILEELRKRGEITIESCENKTILIFKEESKIWFKKVFKLKEKKKMVLFEK